MSIKIMSLVWESSVGKGTKRLVLLALADSANDEGVTWPHMATIARKANCGLSSARKAVAELEADGLLARTMRRVETTDGSVVNTSNLYEINTEKLARLVAETPAQIERMPRPTPRQNPAAPPPNPGGTPARIERDNRKGNHQGNRKNTRDAAEAAPAAGLFEVEQDGKDEPVVNDAIHPGAIVAAYVDSFKAAHRGETPLGMDLRKIGATAKRLLADPNVKADLLSLAATEMGRTAFTDLAGQYRRVTARPTSGAFSPSGDARRGITVVASTPEYRPDDVWAKLAAEQDTINARMTAAAQSAPNTTLEV